MTRRHVLTVAFAVTIAGATASAHHGASAYDVMREITVTGSVVEWQWVNPHVRVVIQVPDATGATATWDCEGPPLSWAAQRGWSDSTLGKGERVTLVMYPPRQNGRTGLIKRIERQDGEVLIVSRPWLDRE